jgi:hypothetical protein
MPGMAQPLPREIKKNAGYSVFCDKIEFNWCLVWLNLYPEKLKRMLVILYFAIKSSLTDAWYGSTSTQRN